MTNKTSVDAQRLNRLLSKAEEVSKTAPEGKEEKIKAAVSVVELVANLLVDSTRSAGLRPTNDDNLRVVEAIIFGYLMASDDDLMADMTVLVIE